MHRIGRLIAVLACVAVVAPAAATAAAPRPPRATFEELRVEPHQFEIYGVIFDHGLAASWRLEWGRSPANGHVAKRVGDARKGNQQIVEAVFPVKPGTRYYFRLVAFNSVGKTFTRERHFSLPQV